MRIASIPKYFLPLIFVFLLYKNGTCQSSNTDLNPDIIQIHQLLDSTNQYYFQEGKPVKGKSKADKALILSLEKRYDKGIGQSYLANGYFYEYFQEMDKAFEYYQKAIPYLKEGVGLCDLNNRLGILFGKKENHQSALKYFNDGLKVSERLDDTLYIVKFYNNIGNVHSNMGNAAESLNFHLKAEQYLIELCLSKCDTSLLIEVKLNIAVAHEESGNLSRAKEINLQTLELINKSLNTTLKPLCLNNLGIIEYKMGNLKKSFSYLTQASQIAEKTQNLQALSINYKALANLEMARSNFNQANSWHIKLLDLTNQMNNNEKNRLFEEMGAKFKMKQKNYEIKLLHESASKDKKIKYLITVLLILSCVIGGVSFFYQKKVQANVKLLQESNLKILQQKNELTEEKLKFKNKELVNFALQLVQKNDFLEYLDHKLSSFSSLNEKAKKEINSLSLEIRQKHLVGADISKFQKKIIEIKADFFERLSSQYPTLTKKELTLSAFLSLGLTSKEIASIRGVSNDAIKISRYRLRKKINVDSSVNLNDFFYNI